MPKKGMRVVITGAQRRTIDIDEMTQIVIALGRELAARKPTQSQTRKPEQPTGAPS